MKVPALPEIALLARVCIPVRCQSVLLAYLWLIDAHDTLSADDLDAAVQAAEAAGEALFRERLLGDLRESRERELVRDLLADDLDVRKTARSLLVEGEMLPQQCVIAALAIQVDDLDRDDVRTAIDTVLRRCGRRARPLLALALSRGGGRGVLLLAGRRGPTEVQLEGVAQDVRSELQKTLRLDRGVRIGIGPVVPDAVDASL